MSIIIVAEIVYKKYYIREINMISVGFACFVGLKV